MLESSKFLRSYSSIMLFARLALALAVENFWDEVAQEPLLRRNSTAHEWNALSRRVEGRLFTSTPFAQACFSSGFHSSKCEILVDSYLDEARRIESFSGYINTQWETCQATGEQCLLDWTDPDDPSPVSHGPTCGLGSVSGRYIDVRKPEDVVAAFEFSRKTEIPIVVKNTGHDYKGRSSAPNSLGLWMHHLKEISYNPAFVPEGCVDANPGVTMQAGVQWAEAYAFAEANNITLVGGSDKGVGTVGGWLMGGGHSALSNTMGLGVDRALEFKVVTPDGVLRTANACQNRDLFWALRGGGGGTFGVVLESTVLASPPVNLQVVIVQFNEENDQLTRDLWTILIDNALKWGSEGWGGFVTDSSAIYLTPALSKEEAMKSMQPLLSFGKMLETKGIKGAKVFNAEFPTWWSFFDLFAGDHSADIGANLALASRLIPKDNFQSSEPRSTLLSALLRAHSITPGIRFLVSPPTSYPGDNSTSVTDAWRNSIYHVTLISTWDWNATAAEKMDHYDLASKAISELRKITPDAAYSNEADVYEPNHEIAFWGDHYPELLRIKQKYDPEQLLDCWQCVGWNPNSKRFSCYI